MIKAVKLGSFHVSLWYQRFGQKQIEINAEHRRSLKFIQNQFFMNISVHCRAFMTKWNA